jgi:vancomycin permeability regulator SanA
MLPVIKILFKMLLRLILYSITAAILVLSFAKLLTAGLTAPRISTIKDISDSPVAIVFGAGLWRDGSPTPVLKDRVKTAADLYFAGKAKMLLMSGDNSVENYNEPAAMLAYAKSLGVPEQDIVLDFAGRRTYDTCYRAIKIFGVQNAILVTQRFHLARALYTCKALGLDSYGIPADQRNYRRGSLTYWNIREIFATAVALWEVHVAKPLPILGDPEPIYVKDQKSCPEGGRL